MPMLAACVRSIDSLIRLIGRSAAWLILATVLICAGVALARYLLGFGRIWLQELYVVCFAVCFMLVGPLRLRHRQPHPDRDPAPALVAAHPAWVEIVGCVRVPGALAAADPVVEPALRAPVVAGAGALAQPGGLPGLFLVKSAIPLFAALMLLQALAVIGRKVIFLAGRDELLRPAPGTTA